MGIRESGKKATLSHRTNTELGRCKPSRGRNYARLGLQAEVPDIRFYKRQAVNHLSWDENGRAVETSLQGLPYRF
jgi:hypothetical protein